MSDADPIALEHLIFWLYVRLFWTSADWTGAEGSKNEALISCAVVVLAEKYGLPELVEQAGQELRLILDYMIEDQVEPEMLPVFQCLYHPDCPPALAECRPHLVKRYGLALSEVEYNEALT